MPTYTYLCSGCGHQFDAFHSYKERLTDCEKCDTIDTLNKVLSQPIQIAGSNTKVGQKEKVGTKVREAIEDGKVNLEKVKEELYKKSNPNE